MTGNVIQFQNEKSTRILSIDGNFGLCRKKAAGQSVRPPLHNGIFLNPKSKLIHLFKPTKCQNQLVKRWVFYSNACYSTNSHACIHIHICTCRNAVTF